MAADRVNFCNFSGPVCLCGSILIFFKGLAGFLQPFTFECEAFL